MRGEVKPNNKSNLTISVDSNVLEEIKKDSQSQGMSVNAHLNNILQRYLTFYRHAVEQQAVIVPHGFFAGMIELADGEKIKKLLDEKGGSEVITAIFAHNAIPFTIDNLIEYCFGGIGLWSGGYHKFRHKKVGSNQRHLIFEHNFGIKWSEALGSATCKLIKETTTCISNYEVLPTTVIVKVDEK